MSNVLNFPNRARVLTPAYTRRLAQANAAERKLRELGCRILSRSITASSVDLVVDRNPHRIPVECWNVHITVGRAA